jgi:Peptidase family S41
MMLRPLYRSLLRLHPLAFRRRFSGEMLSIFDQTAGGGASFKLLADALFSLARQWTLRREFWSGRSPAQVPSPEGVPAFLTLDPFRPRTPAMLYGIALSTLVFAATCFAIRYSWIHVLHIRIPEAQSEPHLQPALEDRSEIAPRVHDSARLCQSGSTGLSQSASVGLPNPDAVRRSDNPHGTTVQPLPAAVTQSITSRFGQPGFANRGDPGTAQPSSGGDKGLAAGQASYASQRWPNSHDSAASTATAQDEGKAVDAAQQHRVIQAAISNLEQHYVDHSVAGPMATALRSHETNGDDSSATDGDVFARLLTKQLRTVNPDKLLEVVYSHDVLPAHPSEPTPAELAQYRKVMQERNCDFEKIQILPKNIGYLKLNSFSDPSICGSTAASAMASLNAADAIIFDLRDNRGGDPEMVARMAAYLFDHPEYWYNPRENISMQSWTKSPVPGNKLADKPVYVLTSHSTYSGAEQFCYDLKMLKRATLIGETTGGGAHAGVFYRIDDHFGIAVPEVRAINPYATPGWAGSGVEPDVKVSAADSLKTAVSLAESKLQTRR